MSKLHFDQHLFITSTKLSACSLFPMPCSERKISKVKRAGLLVTHMRNCTIISERDNNKEGVLARSCA